MTGEQSTDALDRIAWGLGLIGMAAMITLLLAVLFVWLLV